MVMLSKLESYSRKLLFCFLLLINFLAICSAFGAPSGKLQYNIIGIKGNALENVKKRLLTVESSPQKFLQSGPKEIQLALEPYGYFHASVKTKIQNHMVNFYVNTGKPLYITHLSVYITGEGENDKKLKKILTKLPLRENQIFNGQKYEKTKQYLFNAALENGYLHSNFIEHKILIDLKKNTCDIRLGLDTGHLFYFGSLIFSPSLLSEELLHRYAPFHPGEKYSPQKIEDFQSRLYNSGYFKLVEVSPEISQNSQYVPIQTKIVLGKKQRLNAGIGFGTDTGPRVSAKNQWLYINSLGHSVTLETTLSSVRNFFQASYSIPGKDPAIDQYQTNISLVTNNLPEGISRTEQLGLSKIKSIGTHWKNTLSLNYQMEQFEFEQKPAQSTHFLIPHATWSYLKSNDPTFPTEGNRFSIDFQGAVSQLLSDTTFLQMTVQDKFIHHFTKNDRLILRGDIGYTAVKDLSLLPLSLRFYAGGAQSIRGFSYQSLGSGKYLLTASAEWQQRLYKRFYGAVFFDAGNALNQLSFSLERSAGIGIVWGSPVGTIELTYARVLSLPDHPSRLQFVLGADL